MRSPAVVSLLDIYPTLVDLFGLPPNDKVQGRCLKPLLEDPKYALRVNFDDKVKLTFHGVKAALVNFVDSRCFEENDCVL